MWGCWRPLGGIGASGDAGVSRVYWGLGGSVGTQEPEGVYGIRGIGGLLGV